LLIPVVVPDFALVDAIFLVFILVPAAAGAAFSSLEAPGGDDVCAEAIAVAPMKILLFGMQRAIQNPQRLFAFPHTQLFCRTKRRRLR
jgi:hypothetical protein